MQNASKIIRPAFQSQLGNALVKLQFQAGSYNFNLKVDVCCFTQSQQMMAMINLPDLSQLNCNSVWEQKHTQMIQIVASQPKERYDHGLTSCTRFGAYGLNIQFHSYRTHVPPLMHKVRKPDRFLLERTGCDCI